ncbi:hypothetical protein niasHT_006654 [Heterodera trifolii]|uniref:Uncharacterized protein n=1 Tax=Heterodera trifolii TaxID=157864 RepID=A0ABD2M9T2_9BILA
MLRNQIFWIALLLALLRVAQLAPSHGGAAYNGYDESETEENEGPANSWFHDLTGNIFSGSMRQPNDEGNFFSESTRQSTNGVFHNDEEDEELKQLKDRTRAEYDKEQIAKAMELSMEEIGNDPHDQEIEAIKQLSLKEQKKREKELIKLAIQQSIEQKPRQQLTEEKSEHEKLFHDLNAVESEALQLYMLGLGGQAKALLSESAQSRAKVKGRYELWKIQNAGGGNGGSVGTGNTGAVIGSARYGGAETDRPYLNSRPESSKAAAQRGKAVEQPKEASAGDEGLNEAEKTVFKNGLNMGTNERKLSLFQLSDDESKDKVFSAWLKQDIKEQKYRKMLDKNDDTVRRRGHTIDEQEENHTVWREGHHTIDQEEEYDDTVSHIGHNTDEEEEDDTVLHTRRNRDREEDDSTVLHTRRNRDREEDDSTVLHTRRNRDREEDVATVSKTRRNTDHNAYSDIVSHSEQSDSNSEQYESDKVFPMPPPPPPPPPYSDYDESDIETIKKIDLGPIYDSEANRYYKKSNTTKTMNRSKSKSAKKEDLNDMSIDTLREMAEKLKATEEAKNKNTKKPSGTTKKETKTVKKNDNRNEDTVAGSGYDERPSNQLKKKKNIKRG